MRDRKLTSYLFSLFFDVHKKQVMFVPKNNATRNLHATDGEIKTLITSYLTRLSKNSTIASLRIWYAIIVLRISLNNLENITVI